MVLLCLVLGMFYRKIPELNKAYIIGSQAAFFLFIYTLRPSAIANYNSI